MPFLLWRQGGISLNLEKELFCRQDPAYRKLMISLLPSVPEETIIGVRTPLLRKLAADFTAEERRNLMRALPHRLFEENQLHAFMVSQEKSFPECIRMTEAFLPYVDNWATCDQMRPVCFAAHREELFPYAVKWVRSGRTYTIRFGLGILMKYYLSDPYAETCIRLAAETVSAEYYVNMMRAWFFAEALVRQYDAAIPYFEDHQLDHWTHLRGIQKALDSRRIPSVRKEYLKSLRRRQQV